MNISSEKWAPVPGYENFYEVSDFGRIRSLRTLKLKTLQRIKKSTGSDYWGVLLYRPGEPCKFVRIHRLVLSAFVGPCPDGMQCCHRNGDGMDNRLENLRWGTPKENHDDRERMGHVVRGEQHPNAKLTAASALEIKRSPLSGVALSTKYGVHSSVIYGIKKGASWKSL